MTPREELEALRRLAQLEAKAKRVPEKAPDPTEGNSLLQNVAIGAGKAVADTGRGIRQLASKVGIGDAEAIQQEIDESRRLDAPLMNTGGGITGNIAGHAAMTLLPAGALSRAPGAVGAVGRSMLTAPASVQGAAVGAGMGAAQAGIQPVATGENRMANALVGGAAGAAVPVAGMAFKGAKAAVEPLYRGGRDLIVGRAMNSAAGQGSDDAVRALMGAQELIPGSAPTAAQVSGNGGIAALERTARAIDPQAYAARDLEQNTARALALRGIAQDAPAMEAAVSARTSTTAPLRDAALNNANYGTRKTLELEQRIAGKTDAVQSALRDKGRFATTEAQQTTLARNFVPVEGMPRIPGRYSHNIERAQEAGSAVADAAKLELQRKAERQFLEGQLDALRQSGYSPLNASGITGQINRVVSQPGMRASDVVTKTLSEIQGKIASLADDAGNINARDLYTIRKEIGNTISKHAKESANWDKRLASGVERDVQRAIDSALEKAGAGDLWKQYLTKYQELSKPINQMEVGQYLLDKLKPPLTDMGGNTGERAAAYAQALRDAPRTLKSATGFGGYDDLSQVMTPQQMGTIQNVGRDLARKVDAEQLGRGVGSDTVQKLAMTNILERAGLPQFVGNMPGLRMASQFAYGGPEEQMKQRLAQALLNPQEAAQLMQGAVPSAAQERMARALLTAGTPALTAGTSSMLNRQ